MKNYAYKHVVVCQNREQIQSCSSQCSEVNKFILLQTYEPGECSFCIPQHLAQQVILDSLSRQITCNSTDNSKETKKKYAKNTKRNHKPVLGKKHTKHINLNHQSLLQFYNL